jgi:hypothetical protein
MDGQLDFGDERPGPEIGHCPVPPSSLDLSWYERVRHFLSVRFTRRSAPNWRVPQLPDGSHLPVYVDQAVYFAGLIDFGLNLNRS